MVVRTNRLTKTTHKGQATSEKLAPRDGFEPPAKRLTVACSTAELPGIKSCVTVIHNNYRYASLFCYKSVLTGVAASRLLSMLVDLVMIASAKRLISSAPSVVAATMPVSRACLILPDR